MTRTLLPLVAIGGGLAVTPAVALELGELTVQSNLGQPLRASIAYALAPNEMLSTTCVSIGGGRSTSGLPGIGPSSISITERAILITGQSAVREPMLGTRVTITCPYTPNLSREYMLFVDPATTAQASQAAAPVVAAAAPVATVTAAPATARATRTSADQAPIDPATRIQVQPGDSLGEIASRIRNRPVGLWPAVNAIFAANPDAFIDNDPNKLKAGSWLTIPSFDGNAAVITDATPTEAAPVQAAAETPAASADGGVYEPPVLEDIIEPVVETTTASESTRELRPGDVILDSVNPYVEPTTTTTGTTTAETVIIPDTQLPGPETASTSPNVTTATISAGSSNESTSFYAWLIGGGLAIIAALVLFGRRVRNRFGSTPVAAAASATAAHEVTDTVEAEAVCDIDDDSPTHENLALDADLILGTGLADGTDMDVAQDFGFASTTELDIEFPFEDEESVADSETDIIAAPNSANVESILESEVLPEDDDYDMSVIIDATQMPQSEDVTERDLMAVPVSAADETLISDNYTISKEVDYDILEQDYEEEMTATQALNEEISRAAAELSRDLDETVSDAETAAMPLATVTELDVTAQLPTQEEKTAELEPLPIDPNDTAAVTISLSTNDETAEMPVANDDETAEMEISGGKVDTSKG